MMNVQYLFRLIPFAAIQMSLLLICSAVVNSPAMVEAAADTGTLSWTANVESDLAGYELFWGDHDGVYNHPNSPISVGTVTSYHFAPGTLVPGVTYYFALKAKDSSGNLSGLSDQESGELPPDRTPPTVSITSPTDGSNVSGTVLVSATASDTFGIEHVQFFIDGNPFGSPDTSEPYEINWDSSGVTGSHTLSAQARDNAGLETTTPEITVTVVPPIFSLTINLSGTGTGTVTSDIGAITCPGVCTDNYADGTPVTLTAQADPGSEFSGWSGTGCSGTSPCAVTMDQIRVVFATFNIPGSEFQQDAGADGLISLEAEHAHANTPQGSHSWTPSTPVGSSGDGAFDATPNTGTTNNKNYSTLSPQLDFEVNFVYTGTHYVWVRGIGLTSGDDSVHVGLDGQELSTSDRIDGFSPTWTWSKSTKDGPVATIDIATPGLHTVNVWMREDGLTLDKVVLTINAAYVPTGTGPAESPQGPPPTEFPLTVTLAGSGTVTSDIGTITCPGVCTDNYAEGTPVTLTAQANPGSIFDGWSGAGCTGTSLCAVTMDQSHNVTATFSTIPEHNLTVTLSGDGSGSVSSDVGAISCPTNCSDLYTQDTVVTLTSQPAEGSQFTGWDGGDCSGTAPCVLTMNQTYVVIANFENEPPPPDTTPPTVNITNPSQGDEVNGIVTISADAFDDIGVDGVRFLVNDVPFGAEDTIAPYSVDWDTSVLLPDSYALKAIARDAEGNETTSDTVTVSVAAPPIDNAFPTVSITAPASGDEVSGLVSINATASDNVGVMGVRFLVNNVLIGVEDLIAPYSTQWDTTSLPLGPYELTAIARDSAGNDTISVMIPVNVIDPPTGTFAITNLTVESGKPYEVLENLQNGERVYIDRSYTFKTVPGAITGATYIKTANNDKNSTGNTFLSFTVDQPVTVYVGHDLRITNKPSWLNSFTPTGMLLVTTDKPLELYSKSFPAGTIALGGNNTGTGKSMYSVVVTSDGPPVPDTTPPTVSLTAPSEGQDVVDVVTLSATAMDNIGVTGVRFLVNDVQVGSEDTTAPYSVQWDTSPLTPGPYELKAIARDDAGNETTSDIVNVTVVDSPTGPFAITNLTVESGKPYEVLESLQNGERVYIDRSYIFKTVPGAITGATYIKTANNDKSSTGNTFLSFTVDQPVTVYVGHDNRITPKPSWLNSFTNTGMTLETSDTTLDLYSQSFPAGTVVLGGNGGAKKSMYSVVITSP